MVQTHANDRGTNQIVLRNPDIISNKLIANFTQLLFGQAHSEDWIFFMRVVKNERYPTVRGSR